MALMKWWIKIGLLGILMGLFMGISQNGMSQEPKEKEDQKAYDKYVKTTRVILSEIDKVGFALESGADPKKSWEKLESNVDKRMEGKDLLEGVKRPVISDMLLGQTTFFYGNAIKCLSKNKDSRIALQLLKIAKGFSEITGTCLEKEEVITKKDCSLCQGDGTIQCHWCALENAGICPSCKGKSCAACDKTGICPVCLGIGGIPCPIDTVISSGPKKPDSGRISANESSAGAALKLLTSCEATWLQQDCDGNGLKDYWTYDVSCLHRMYRVDGSTKVAFIPIDMAKADNKPADMKGGELPFGKNLPIEPWDKITLSAKSGYFFRAMLTDGSGNSYNINGVGINNIKATNNSQFAFVAYPEKYGVTGVNTFIVNQEGTIYATDCGSDEKKIVLQWPGANPMGEKGPGGKNWIVAD